MTTPVRTPKRIKLEMFYDTSGAIIIECNQKCGYHNTMLPTDFFPTDNHYFMRHTIDEVYHALRHMQYHVQCHIDEGSKDDAEQSGPVHPELSSRDAVQPVPAED